MAALVCVFVGFCDLHYVSQLPCVRYYAVVKSHFKHANPRGPMCFRCMMFNLSGHCELLFLLCFVTSWT